MRHHSDILHNIVTTAVVLLLAMVLLTACSTTRNIPEDDQLYIGLKKIEYTDYERSDHAQLTREEVEASLACTPNGALFGSSYYRTMLPYSLWIWNAFSDSENKMLRWLSKTLGSEPVLMSWVNPTLRSRVAESVLRSHGYFNGKVDFSTITMKNPRKAKIAYNVDMGHLYTLDTIAYVGFPTKADSLIQRSLDDAMIHAGSPFSATTLDGERTRVSNLLRNNGYYYYQSGYSTYQADTVSSPGKVQLRLTMSEDTPYDAQRQWYIGNMRINIMKNSREPMTDSLILGQTPIKLTKRQQRQREKLLQSMPRRQPRQETITLFYNGRRPRLRPRVILRNMKMRRGRLYSAEDYQETVSRLAANGLFSSTDIRFTPRKNGVDTLDMTLSCVFDKPYDFYVEGNLTGKTSQWFGPGVVIGLTKRNAFHGAEKLDINLKGSYEWQTGHKSDGTSSRIHSYEYGADASMELPRMVPRLINPRIRPPQKRDSLSWWANRYFTPQLSTILKASSDVINRAGYFKRHIVSGELTYNIQLTPNTQHSLTPLMLQYNYMTSHTEEFDAIMETSPYLKVSMRDQFIPQFKYTYRYTSPQGLRNPVYAQFSFSESANLLSATYAIFGEKWNDEDKTMFKNPYAQFVKFEGDWRKSWQVGSYSSLVAHANAGIIWSYGNSKVAPYTEQFYVGGANSIRAFNVRAIGPGSFKSESQHGSYLDQTGDIKLLLNLEYRQRLFGSLQGAIFLDAGNVWALREDENRPGATLKMKDLLKETAVGTGVGLRYDLDYFVVRIDWGVGLHLPYKSGYFNIGKLRDAQSIHFAIGYPF